MLDHLEKTWDRCLCEAKRSILDERLASASQSDPFPELPTDVEAVELARTLFWKSQASAMAKGCDQNVLY